MKILVVAQNPKTELNVHYPLRNTRSYKIFKEWLYASGLTLSSIQIVNALDKVGEFAESEYKERTKDTDWKDYINQFPFVVCLGKKASLAVGSVDGFVLDLPHPSGLNRKLNNKYETVKVVEELKALKSAYEGAKVCLKSF